MGLTRRILQFSVEAIIAFCMSSSPSRRRGRSFHRVKRHDGALPSLHDGEFAGWLMSNTMMGNLFSLHNVVVMSTLTLPKTSSKVQAAEPLRVRILVGAGQMPSTRVPLGITSASFAMARSKAALSVVKRVGSGEATALLRMAHGPAADDRLGNGLHLNGARAGVDADVLERAQRHGVDQVASMPCNSLRPLMPPSAA